MTLCRLPRRPSELLRGKADIELDLAVMDGEEEYENWQIQHDLQPVAGDMVGTAPLVKLLMRILRKG